MNMIRALREKLDISQEKLAARVGTSQPQIKRLEAGERKLTKEWAERIAPHLGVNPEELMFGGAASALALNHVSKEPEKAYETEIPNAQIRGKVEGFGRKIPVFGQAVGGIDGEFLMNGSILFEVMAPPVISHLSKAYAVSVAGDSMSPRYEDGEICFVDPSRRVKRGDYVIAQIRLEEEGAILAYVKRFVRWNSDELVLEQFNPAKELRFRSENVVSVHFIALSGIA